MEWKTNTGFTPPIVVLLVSVYTIGEVQVILTSEPLPPVKLNRTWALALVIPTKETTAMNNAEALPIKRVRYDMLLESEIRPRTKRRNAVWSSDTRRNRHDGQSD